MGTILLSLRGETASSSVFVVGRDKRRELCVLTTTSSRRCRSSHKSSHVCVYCVKLIKRSVVVESG